MRDGLKLLSTLTNDPEALHSVGVGLAHRGIEALNHEDDVSFRLPSPRASIVADRRMTSIRLQPLTNWSLVLKGKVDETVPAVSVVCIPAVSIDCDPAMSVDCVPAMSVVLCSHRFSVPTPAMHVVVGGASFVAPVSHCFT